MIVFTTKNNIKVFMDMDTKKHILEAHPDVEFEIIEEAIEKIVFPEDCKVFTKLAEVVDLGRPIGRTNLVEAHNAPL